VEIKGGNRGGVQGRKGSRGGGENKKLMKKLRENISIGPKNEKNFMTSAAYWIGYTLTDGVRMKKRDLKKQNGVEE